MSTTLKTKQPYLTWEDIVPSSFTKRPQTVVVEAGNGMGKTQSAIELAVKYQALRSFERIYFLEYSQEAIERVVYKITKAGGWAVRYLGLQKFCPRYEDVEQAIRLGLPASAVCYECPFFKGKSRVAYSIVRRQILNLEKKIIEPTLSFVDILTGMRVCTHPIFRRMVVEPTSDLGSYIRERGTPIFVVPVHLFVNYNVLFRLLRFSRRQRKPRKWLFIIDEADTIFYNAFEIRVPYLEFTQEDYEVLRTVSNGRHKYEVLLEYYNNIWKKLEVLYSKSGGYWDKVYFSIKATLKRADALLSSLSSKYKRLLRLVLESSMGVNIFIALRVLYALRLTPDLRTLLATLERDRDTFILNDYNMAVDLLFDNSFPIKNIWKINLTATFPTEAIYKSDFLTARSQAILGRVIKLSRTYENVYVKVVDVYKGDNLVVNRNLAVPSSVPKILQSVVKIIQYYGKEYGAPPRGVVLWFGNKQQFAKYISKTSGRRGVDVSRLTAVRGRLMGTKILVSYVGSPISRSVDLDEFDISFVVAPLLRPPRRGLQYDPIDVAKAIAETVQAAMRVVRSPRPERPKIVVLERSVSGPFYARFYPKWFLDLAIKS